MEKITLHQLAPYLPYGLKIQIGSIKEGYCLEMTIEDEMESGYISLTEVIESEAQPIFHPLSELEGTEQWKEIVSEHNYPDFGHFERSVLSGHAPYKLIMELVKEHFWIYDQSYFEKKIILDISELNK